ncbi:MAG TPA: type II toxin-antitoxin system VapC family toxin [Longimicrobium sp.]
MIHPATAPVRNVVDTSGWLEYMTNGPNSNLFAPAIEDTDTLVVPTVSVLEVFRWVLRERGESDALQATAMMQQGIVVDLDAALALKAAKLGHTHKLPLADSVIYATAREYNAVLWTQDGHFAGLADVEYHPKHQPSSGTT